MRLMIWKQNEGPTDQEMKAGDIFAVKPTTWEPGEEETKTWLVVEMPDYGGSWDELVSPEYTVGPTPEEPAILRMRKYYISFDGLTDLQTDRWRNPNTKAPIVKNVWGIQDILRR